MQDADSLTQLQCDGQQNNNADTDKNSHIFAHCLNNEIWVETNEGQKTAMRIRNKGLGPE